MDTAQRFDAYLKHLAEGLGHRDRHQGLRGYCTVNSQLSSQS